MSFTTTSEELSSLLGEAGHVVRVHIGTDRETGKSRGFSFAEFGSPEEATEAIKRFDGYDLGGRKLRVNNAEDRPARSGGGGPRPSGGFRPSPAPRFAPSSTPAGDMFAPGDPFAAEMAGYGGGGGRGFKNNKGSRRGIRARKRSLGY